MATALQCPECGHRHKLADLPDTALFRCHNCDRVLKVPDSLRAPLGSVPATPAAASPRAARTGRTAPAATTSAPAVSRTVDPDATVASPALRPAANGTATTGAARPSAIADAFGAGRGSRVDRSSAGNARHPATGSLALPMPVRAGAWIVALAGGFVIAAVFLKLVGVLNVESAMNVFVGNGVGRFGAVIALVPLWALCAAGLAHGALEGAARLWPHGTANQDAGAGGAAPGAAASQPPERP